MIEAIAASLGLPFGLLSALIGIETGGQNLIAFHDGHTPSYGLVQIKMRTAKEVDPEMSATDLLNPEKNIRLGGLYLLKLHKRYGDWNRVLCHYNTGKGMRECSYSKRVRKAWALEKVAVL